jgi:Yip1 domain
VLALVLLAGIAGVLWTPTVGRLLEDKLVAWDGLLIAVVVFFGGGIYATFAYWTLGLVLHAAASPFRATRSYRQARHVLAFAAAPVALSLFVLWPVRLAVYGEDVFRKGGSDRGAGNWAFVGLELLFVAWALGLLLLGLSIIRSNSSSSSNGIS